MPQDKRDLPMLPWFPKDFYTSTAGWTFVERSLYRVLLDHQWMLGKLPDDRSRLARIADMPQDQFDEAWTQVGQKFEQAHDGLYNDRLEHHREESHRLADAKSSAARAAGLASAERRRNAGSTSRSTTVPTPVEPDVQRHGQQPSNASQPSISSPSTSKETREEGGSLTLTSPPSAKSSKPKKGEGARKHRLEDLELTPERIAWAEAHVPEVDLPRAHEGWVNYVRSKNPVYTDWDAAWRSGMMREFAPKKRIVPQGGQREAFRGAITVGGK